jgi:hypothetical protein
MRFQDIPQFPFASYRCNIGWGYLEDWLTSHDEYYKLDLDPPYQRGYVWTMEQKTAYIEYQLRGGFSGRDIFWNCPNWMSRGEIKGNKMEIVDGKQRISAVREFLVDEVPAFGLLRSQFEGSQRLHEGFIFHINNLSDPKDVVEWYLGINRGGSIHTDEDLRPAYELLKQLSTP